MMHGKSARSAILAATLSLSAAAAAHPVTLTAPAPLLATAGAPSSAITSLHAGATVQLLHHGKNWSRIRVARRVGYVRSDVIVPVDPPQVVYLQSADRRCDYGYPYSGSDAYFTGLVELRTSEPLGALFGYHRRWPC